MIHYLGFGNKLIYNSVIPLELSEAVKTGIGLFSRGFYTQKFGADIEKFIGSNVILLDSGLSAIRLYLKLINLNKGDEIAIPAYICNYVIEGLISDGYSLNYIDVDNNYNISPIDLEKKISPSTKVVIGVHTYGMPFDITRIHNITKKNNSVLLDDSAQSFGVLHNNTHLGNYGDAGIFSFGWFKPLTTMGGGALVLKDQKLLEEAKRLVKFDFSFKQTSYKYTKTLLFTNKFIYYNIFLRLFDKFYLKVSDKHNFSWRNNLVDNETKYKGICDVQAILGRQLIKKINGFNDLRVKNTRSLIKLLSNCPIHFTQKCANSVLLRLPGTVQLNFKKVQEISRIYFRNKIDVPILYPISNRISDSHRCPNAKYLSEHTLNFPIHPCMNEQKLKMIKYLTEKIFQELI